MLLAERKLAPLDEALWIAEPKFDGYRLLAEFGGGTCPLRTRNGADCTSWFPELSVPLSEMVCGRTVVDAEVCILDGIGRSDFEALHSRARRRRWKGGDTPVVMCTFDLLVLKGRSVMDRELIEHKRRLASLLDLPPANVLYVRHVDAKMTPDPVSWLYRHALSLEMEGVVGKRPTSVYRPGERTDDWFKWKRRGATPPERFQRSKS
jgi:bifunctional non-homologous end joining protein LigD